mmetsp:Transcript_34944/g.41163  ORF Transcript_34944/g.41163 Transcript_34944/m.41163 type:complete len:233 (-) Transcript_34944:1208-1906(-)
MTLLSSPSSSPSPALRCFLLLLRCLCLLRDEEPSTSPFSELGEVRVLRDLFDLDESFVGFGPEGGVGLLKERVRSIVPEFFGVEFACGDNVLLNLSLLGGENALTTAFTCATASGLFSFIAPEKSYMDSLAARGFDSLSLLLPCCCCDDDDDVSIMEGLFEEFDEKRDDVLGCVIMGSPPGLRTGTGAFERPDNFSELLPRRLGLALTALNLSSALASYGSSIEGVANTLLC